MSMDNLIGIVNEIERHRLRMIHLLGYNQCPKCKGVLKYRGGVDLKLNPDGDWVDHKENCK
jgi:Zn-finger nucleic acid-binding protein